VFTIHRSIDLDFAHHVRGHLGPCINIHGHTWKFEVGCKATELDSQGFVIDFAYLEKRVLQPCHDLLDHSLAIGAETYHEISDALVPLGENLRNSRQIVHGHMADESFETIETEGARLCFPGGLRVAVFPFVPTSERL
ncbi:uncharacterized protein METZ01_LOCUS508451, partial [marine metagenome]